MFDSLPLPILIGAGMLLAIASNRDKRSRLLPRLRDSSVAPSGQVPPTASASSPQTDSPQSTVQLPDIGRSPASTQNSISFKIED